MRHTIMRLDLYHQLKETISGEVRWDNASRVLYSTDASNFQMFPQGVVLPKNEQDVLTTLKICREQNIPITLRGGGSSLAGQAIGPGIILDTSKYFNRILEIDVEAQTVRVEPGVVLGKLNQHLASYGLQFGPDPASAARATVGGIIGTNATGAHSIRYGMTADNVVGLRCALADGRIVEFKPNSTEPLAQELTQAVVALATRYEGAIRRDFPKVWRRASGYNLDFIAEMGAYDTEHPADALTDAQRRRKGLNYDIHLQQISQLNLAPLIVGSDGTLAIVLEATLKLVPKPKHTALVVTSFQSLVEAMEAVPLMLEVHPSAIELIGHQIMQLAANSRDLAEKMGWADANAEGVLVVEFEGESAEEARAGVNRLLALAEEAKFNCRLEVIYDPAAQADVWNVRKLGLAILMSIRSEFKPISVIEDVAVPVEHLADYVRGLQGIFRDHETDGAFYAHASAGVLHVRPMVNIKTEAGVAAMDSIAEATLALCHRFGGAMSGEHGDGYERSRWNEALFGQELYQAFCELKDLFDPQGILNPGNKVRGEAITAELRLGPTYYATPIPTVFHYKKDHSIAHLAEECNGSGVCRKLSDGVMCPSYRVTLEEQHSTRGRANLLRDLMSQRRGDGTAGTTTQEEVKEALDLCLSCKACASECSSQVDMAKMKADFTQRYYDQKGTPLRAWLLGRIALLSQLATLIPAITPIANSMANLPIMKRVLRLAERPLPAFSSETFNAWWKGRTKTIGRKGRVVLYVDTFTRYNHPQIGKAAVGALEQSGYEVIVPEWKCCGRPLVSQGQPRVAAELARQNIKLLAPYAKQGLPILGLEPSCISMFKADYPDLIPSGDTDAVAGAFLSVEQFLAEHGKSSTVGEGKQVLLHGHCHQKAVYGTNSTKQMLQKAGYQVQEINSTCCGMAGAFGFEAEHFEVSKQIGELSLLPAVRSASNNTLIVAPGTSCRQQIEELAEREVWHPVELL
jgi:FAD/FMN-containing dehydrogenase/Fe-S oxidoreductase